MNPYSAAQCSFEVTIKTAIELQINLNWKNDMSVKAATYILLRGQVHCSLQNNQANALYLQMGLIGNPLQLTEKIALHCAKFVIEVPFAICYVTMYS